VIIVNVLFKPRISPKLNCHQILSFINYTVHSLYFFMIYVYLLCFNNLLVSITVPIHVIIKPTFICTSFFFTFIHDAYWPTFYDIIILTISLESLNHKVSRYIDVSEFPCHLIPFRLKYSPFSYTLSLFPSLRVTDQD
jgi:hypothetical protein